MTLQYNRLDRKSHITNHTSYTTHQTPHTKDQTPRTTHHSPHIIDRTSYTTLQIQHITRTHAPVSLVMAWAGAHHPRKHTSTSRASHSGCVNKRVCACVYPHLCIAGASSDNVLVLCIFGGCAGEGLLLVCMTGGASVHWLSLLLRADLRALLGLVVQWRGSVRPLPSLSSRRLQRLLLDTLLFLLV